MNGWMDGWMPATAIIIVFTAHDNHFLMSGCWTDGRTDTELIVPQQGTYNTRMNIRYMKIWPLTFNFTFNCVHSKQQILNLCHIELHCQVSWATLSFYFILFIFSFFLSRNDQTGRYKYWADSYTNQPNNHQTDEAKRSTLGTCNNTTWMMWSYL